jgi:hypothetical protein
MNRLQRTEAEQLAFFEQSYERFLKAKASAGSICRFYRIAGTTVCLQFAGEKLIPHLTPALEHLLISDVDSPDFTLCLWDSDSTSMEMVPAPFGRESYSDRGEIWGFNGRRIRTAFHWVEYSVNLMDLETKRGIFWVRNADHLPYWTGAAPLRTLFHWWLEKNDSQLLHAAAVGTKEGAVLITGKGGIGKSTTALACLNSGLYYLGDDYVIASLKPFPRVFSLYSTAKLNSDHLANFPEFSRFVQNPENLDEEKAVIFLHPHFEKQIAVEMPIKALLMPQIVGRDETRLVPAPRFAIRQAASFTTMSQLPGAGHFTYDLITRLSSSLPGYSLELGSNLNRISSTISEFVRNPDEAKPRKSIHPETLEDPKAKPLVSVIVPVFNGERFIKEAVENILAQNYPSLELIIVDDGSTDNTGEIIEKIDIDIRYFRQENAGPASARNRGIRCASGELIAFLDVDDLWPENNLNSLVDEMCGQPDIDVIHGHSQEMFFDPEKRCYVYGGSPKESFPYSVSAAIFRTAVFSKVGLFDTTLLFGEDSDWFIRAKELQANIKRLESVTYIVRRHGQNMTHGKNLVQLNTLRVFKKTLDRRRAQPRNTGDARPT